MRELSQLFQYDRRRDGYRHIIVHVHCVTVYTSTVYKFRSDASAYSAFLQSQLASCRLDKFPLHRGLDKLGMYCM